MEIAFPITGSTLVSAEQFGESLFGNTAKLVVRLPDGNFENYFLKVVPKLGDMGKRMCEGEFEALKAIEAVSPGFVPTPYAWGQADKDQDTYFLLVEFRHIGQQVCSGHPCQLATNIR